MKIHPDKAIQDTRFWHIFTQNQHFSIDYYQNHSTIQSISEGTLVLLLLLKKVGHLFSLVNLIHHMLLQKYNCIYVICMYTVFITF